MSKRKNGEGSWGIKNIKGIQYRYFRDTNGHYTYGKTEKEIKEKLKKQREPIFQKSKKETFGEYIVKWHQNRQSGLEPSTYDCYETMIESMIINFKKSDLSNTYLTDLSDIVFSNYLSSLATKYARASIGKMWAIIKTCVKYGEVKGDIKPNTTYGVKIPNESMVAVKKKEVCFLSKDETENFYKEAMSGKYGINADAAVFIMYSGLRVSEMIALKWNAVSKDCKTIEVKSSIGERKNRTGVGPKTKTYEKEPKTEKGKRIIPLPQRATDILIKQPTKKGTVFLSKAGTPLTRHNTSRTVTLIAKNAKLNDGITAHSLRHTYGSILLEEKVDIKKVSELLGHADIRTTYNIYIQILDKDKRSEIERVYGN